MKHLPLSAGKKPGSEYLLALFAQTCAWVVFGVSLGFVALIAVETLALLERIPVRQVVGGLKWVPLSTQPDFAFLPLLWGSLWSLIIAGLVALPSGLALATYLSELGSPTLRTWTRPVLDVLSGIPAVAYGLFAFSFLTPLLQSAIPGLGTFNMLSAGLVLGVMILPTMTSLSEDALRQIPDSVREAGRALGAPPLAVAVYLVLPAASRSLVGAAFLALSRVLGESLIVAMAAGTLLTDTGNPLEAMQSLSSFVLLSGVNEVTGRGDQNHLVFGMALCVFVLTLVLHQFGKRFSGSEGEGKP